MKILTPSVHGILDYVTVGIFLVAPLVLGLTGISTALSYLLAIVHLLMTLVTNFPFGIFKHLPFNFHGWVERIVGPVLVIASFIPMIAPTIIAMSFFLVMGAIIIAVGLLSNYHSDTSPIKPEVL